MYNVNEKLVAEVKHWLDACELDNFKPIENLTEFDYQDFKEWATMGEHQEMINLINSCEYPDNKHLLLYYQDINIIITTIQ
jgi:hypothetical protein